jgi:hypothetical protein
LCERIRTPKATFCDLLTDKQAAERLVCALEEAPGSLRHAHHLALEEGGAYPLIAFHEVCARIADEIDQELNVPIRGQHAGMKERAVVLAVEHDGPADHLND